MVIIVPVMLWAQNANNAEKPNIDRIANEGIAFTDYYG